MAGNSMTEKKTNKKFMVLSALGIIMVVDLHCDIALNLLDTFIPYESFFMPLFVFISGYFNKVDGKTDLTAYVKKKGRTLLLPFVVIGFIMFWLEWIINSYKFGAVQPITQETLIIPAVNVFTVGYPVLLTSPMWFVPSLLLVTLVYAVLRKAFGKKWNSIAAVIVFCLLNIASVWSAKAFGDTQVFFLLLLPMKCIFFLPFMEFGVLYRDKIEPGMAGLSRGGNIILLLALMLLNVIRMMCLPDPQDIVLNSLYNFGGFTSPFVITPLISSVIGILFWVTVADIIGNAFKDNRVVNYISENTFFIMGFHVFFFNLINCILFFINGSITAVPGFDINSFRAFPFYIWEQYLPFKLVYFAVGLTGPLLLKLAADKVMGSVKKH